MAAETDNTLHSKRWIVVVEFFWESLTGVSVLLIIGCAAIFLDQLLKYLTTLNIDIVIIYALKILEYFMLLLDVCLFITFFTRAAYRTWSKL